MSETGPCSPEGSGEGVPDCEVFRYSYSYAPDGPASARVQRVVRLHGQPFLEHHCDSAGGPLLRGGHSTGAAIWPAAPLLCDFLVDSLGRPGLLDRRVAELGCGLGLVGIVAAALVGPAGAVHFTDGDESSVKRAERNAAASREAGDGALSFRVLRWGPGVEASAAASVEAAGPFDVVVGSDLVYPSAGPGTLGFLLEAAALLLRPAGGTFLLGVQRRHVPLAEVAAEAAARGWRVDIPAGGYMLDIFGNRTEEGSDLWQYGVLRFVRGPPASPPPPGYPLPLDL